MSLAQMAPTTSGPSDQAAQTVSQARIQEGSALPSALFKGKKGAFKRLLAGLMSSGRREEGGLSLSAEKANPKAKGRLDPAGLKTGSALSILGQGSTAGADAQKTRDATRAENALGNEAFTAGKLLPPDRKAKRSVHEADQASSDARGRMDALSSLLGRNMKAGNAEKAEKAESSELNAAKKKETRKKGFAIELRDMRSQAAERRQPASDVGKAETAKGNERDMVVELPAPREGRDAKAARAMGSGEVSFSNRLAQALQDNYNQELVRNAQIILRDGDSGTIRLSLRPESLGSVKVALDLADNKVIGKIVVESEAAREAFERNLDGLTQSFVDSGFDGAKLEVAVDGHSSGGSEARFEWTGGEGDRESSEGAKAAAVRYDAEPGAQALDLLA